MMEKKVSASAQQILQQVRLAVSGKDPVLVWVLAAMLAKGHILLEDIPGVGKTTMALAFSKALQLSCSRVQFTPDVLPSDVTGFSVRDQQQGRMVYQPGAVLCNLFLADELNRATSRTQSALLEAMEEGKVTVDGVTHPIPQPFLVMATQNPTGAAGTQLLPDSQMDRFMLRLKMGYPDPQAEVDMVLNRQGGDPLQKIQPVLSGQQMQQLQQLVAQTFVSDLVVRYIVELVTATRKSVLFTRGVSPRATLAVTALAKAIARLRDRDYVLPEDVQEVFVQTTAHRLQLSQEGVAKNVTVEGILQEILSTVPAPKLK